MQASDGQSIGNVVAATRGGAAVNRENSLCSVSVLYLSLIHIIGCHSLI